MSKKFVIGAIVLPLLASVAHPSMAGDADASPWSEGKLSSARLIGAGGLHDKSYSIGFEITLKGRAHTYWKNPGDAGAPPVFDFGGSTNLASASARFPAPRRIVEEGADVFGYLGSVVIPIDVTPTDPRLPVELAMVAKYAACERICIPVEASMNLVLRPEAGSGAFAARIEDAVANLPRPMSPTGPTLKVTAATAKTKPVWRLDFDPPPGADADLFSMPSENWFFSTKRVTASAFELILEEKPSGNTAVPELELTLVDGARSFETRIHLDAAPTTP